MLALSPGASMAWQLAASEAARASQRHIERETVFIGICYLGTWLRSRPAGKITTPTGDIVLGTARAEAKAIDDLLWALGVSPTRLSHAVRMAIGGGLHRHVTKGVVHRSRACKAAFERAAELAALAHVNEIHCRHLLAALLEHPGPALTDAIVECGAMASTLHARVVAPATMPESRPGQAGDGARGVSHLIYMGAAMPA